MRTQKDIWEAVLIGTQQQDNPKECDGQKTRLTPAQVEVVQMWVESICLNIRNGYVAITIRNGHPLQIIAGMEKSLLQE